MEPVFKNSNTPLPQAEQESDISEPQTGSQVTLSQDQQPTATQVSSAFNENDDLNTQIIENLKEQRDQLRGISIEEAGEKPKKNKLKILLVIIVLVVLAGGIYAFVVRPSLNKKDETTSSSQSSQKSFRLPSDLKSKTSEEQNALSIIDLSRRNDATTIINTYLNKAKLAQSEADFIALINSYSTTADGESVELIEKKIGKVDFASTGESSAIAETTSEFDAASLIYKSGYFGHTNNIYLKINLYKPDPTVDSWKMYIFEFKAGDNESPLKADTQVPI